MVNLRIRRFPKPPASWGMNESHLCNKHSFSSRKKTAPSSFRNFPMKKSEEFITICILTLLCAALAIEKPVRSCQNRGNPSGAFNYLPGSTFFLVNGIGNQLEDKQRKKTPLSRAFGWGDGASFQSPLQFEVQLPGPEDTRSRRSKIRSQNLHC